jgi:hypothetical protein
MNSETFPNRTPKMVVLPWLFYLQSLFLWLATSSALSTITPIFELPGSLPSSWFENLAVRPNGLILATRGDAPEIWQIDPSTGVGSILVSVTGAFNLTGIAEITSCGNGATKGSLERYIFGSAYIPAPLVVEPGSARVWSLAFGIGTGTAPTVSLLAELPDAGFINGVTAWGSRNVLLSDTINEAVYLMDAYTGSFTKTLTNMTGINGIRSSPGYLYWASHALQTLSRIPINKDAVATGVTEILAIDQPIDDFAVAVDASGEGVAYIGAMYENAVAEVLLPPAPSSELGGKRFVATNLTGRGMGLCTSVVFGRQQDGPSVLYASASMGGGNAAIMKIRPGGS